MIKELEKYLMDTYKDGWNILEYMNLFGLEPSGLQIIDEETEMMSLDLFYEENDDGIYEWSVGGERFPINMLKDILNKIDELETKL